MIKKLLITASILCWSFGVNAVPIADTGAIDGLVGQVTQGSAALPNSGAGSEESWIESVLGYDVDYTQLAGSGSSSWESVIGGNACDYAFQFGTGLGPVHYLIKVGNGNGSGTDDSHYLFENLGNLNWAYVNLSFFGQGVTLSNVGVISHVGHTGGTVSVPEPGSLILLSFGLIGLGMARKKR